MKKTAPVMKILSKFRKRKTNLTHNLIAFQTKKPQQFKIRNHIKLIAFAKTANFPKTRKNNLFPSNQANKKAAFVSYNKQ